MIHECYAGDNRPNIKQQVERCIQAAAEARIVASVVIVIPFETRGLHAGMIDILKRRRDGNGNKHSGRKSHGTKDRQQHYGKRPTTAPFWWLWHHHGHEICHDKGPKNHTMSS